MKKIIFLACLIVLHACSDMAEQWNTTKQTKDSAENIESNISKEHNEELWNLCACPYCLGILDQKDDISLRSL